MFKIIFSLLLLFICTNNYAFEALFYTDSASVSRKNADKMISRLKQHQQEITLLAPQVYSIDADGHLFGSLDERIIAAAQQMNIQIMPLVVNHALKPEIVHDFLRNKMAQTKTLNQLVQLCRLHHYYGIQFDLEKITTQDRNLYTAFIQKAAQVLHQAHVKISVAVVPSHSAPRNQLYKWLSRNWVGPYNLKQLGKYSDFITLMTYDRHTTYTTPGPIAPFTWVKQTIQSAIRIVPRSKLSLGIPTYSGWWFTHFGAHELQIDYQDSINFIHKHDLSVHWGPDSKSNYAIYNKKALGLNEYLFIEDAQSFEAKLKLVSQYQLRGISVWRMNVEDPKIWGVLATQQRHH